jgi:hypothetical protein
LDFGLPGEFDLDFAVFEVFDLAEPSRAVNLPSDFLPSGDFVPLGDLFPFGDFGFSFLTLSASTFLSCSIFHALSELCPINLSVM